MKREHWKDLIEAVGFVAIIGSLIFVGIESRNSTRQAELMTRALEIEAYQELMTNIEELNILGIGNDAAAATLEQVFPSPDGTEAFKLERAFFLLFRHGDMAYFLFERGAIGESRLRSALSPPPIGSPAGREFWRRRNHLFTDEYRAYVDRMIAERHGVD